MELQGQVAIVTGAGRGIGRATALELARMGADIAIAEMDRTGAERTAGEVTALGRRALLVPTDVTSQKDLAAMAEQEYDITKFQPVLFAAESMDQVFDELTRYFDAARD